MGRLQQEANALAVRQSCQETDCWAILRRPGIPPVACEGSSSMLRAHLLPAAIARFPAALPPTGQRDTQPVA
eukprot:13395290-Alexandrium_andersonii.AAC.1